MRATVVLVMASVLAGCTTAPDGAAPIDDGVSVVTDPRDLLNGTAPGSHVHDYWAGRSAIKILESSEESSGVSCSGCTKGIVIDTIRPAEGIIVPQGTAWINGTFTLEPNEDETTYSHLELWLKTAKDVEPAMWGLVESGKPFSINSTAEQNDPPHYVLSLWSFQLRAYNNQTDTVQVVGTFTWDVEAVRGLTLTPYPPHADRWNGATELDLLTDEDGTMLMYYDPSTSGSTPNRLCYGGCPGKHVLPDGAVVPFDASRVEVSISVTSGIPAGLGLLFHGADTWDEAQVKGQGGIVAPIVFTIPVEASMGDSPYAPQSLWEFRVTLDQPQPGTQAWSGEYTISVIAYK